MMQANADFIPSFAKNAAKLRELTQKSVRYHWNTEHQHCFDALIQTFKKETLLSYFDPNLPTFVMVDAHLTGQASILSQRQSLEVARPVAVASRATNKTEKTVSAAWSRRYECWFMSSKIPWISGRITSNWQGWSLITNLWCLSSIASARVPFVLNA